MFQVSSARAAQNEPQPAIGSKVIGKDSSPLEQLLATATATAVFPITDNQRVKRKPLRFRPKGESRFKPKNFKKLLSDRLEQSKDKIASNIKSRFADFPVKQSVPSEDIVKNDKKVIQPTEFITTEQPEEIQDIFTTPEPVTKKQEKFQVNHKPSRGANIKSRFSGFRKRPSPGPVKQIVSNQNEKFIDIIDQTATETNRDTFSTPEPFVEIHEEVSKETPVFAPKLTNPIPYAVSNDISTDDLYDQSAIFEDLLAKTGAQSVGVTRDVARAVEEKVEKEVIVNRQEHARQISRPRARGRSSGRREQKQNRKSPEQQVLQEEEEYQVPVKVPLPPRRKKSNFAKKKKKHGKKSNVGTLESYRYKNEDGSITWGYHNDDGSFKEETIGMDCITHGKYGYTDSYGEEKEYSYSSGVRCDPDTRKVKVSDPGTRGSNGHGYFDYKHNKFVMPDGR